MILRFSPAAANDLYEIESYISKTSPDAAVQLSDSLYESCVNLVHTPDIGPVRNDIKPDLRYWPHTSSNYLIFYRVIDDTVEIARILHGSMDYRTQIL